METTEEVEEKGGREARRRRIVERGSDRIALITGQIKTLPYPSSPHSSPKHFHTQSSPAVLLQDLPSPHTSTNPSDQFHIDRKDEDDASNTSTKHKIIDKLSRGNAFNFRGRVESPLRKCESNIGATEAPTMEAKNEPEPLSVTPTAPKAPVHKEVLRGGQLHFFTAKEINSCIIASETIRVFCSLVIALLVVLSNINLPHNIVKSRSPIASRPLYILLLTDITIVLVRMLEKRRVSEKAEENEKLGPQEDGQNWAGAFQILEIGLVFYQIIRGIFIDCSFYMVVVICGLSLV